MIFPFKLFSVKCLRELYAHLHKLIKFIYKRPKKIAKMISVDKNEGLVLSDVRTDYKAIIIKTVRYWREGR